MSKSARRRGPIEQYDHFMSGGKTHVAYRGLFTAGAWVGNTLAWFVESITVARLSIVLAFIVVSAVALGILQRVTPTLELSALLLVSAIIGLIVVTIGVIVLKLVLRRDAQHLSQEAIFGVNDEDARTRDKQNYRRKSGR